MEQFGILLMKNDISLVHKVHVETGQLTKWNSLKS